MPTPYLHPGTYLNPHQPSQTLPPHHPAQAPSTLSATPKPEPEPRVPLSASSAAQIQNVRAPWQIDGLPIQQNIERGLVDGDYLKRSIQFQMAVGVAEAMVLVPGISTRQLSHKNEIMKNRGIKIDVYRSPKHNPWIRSPLRRPVGLTAHSRTIVHGA